MNTRLQLPWILAGRMKTLWLGGFLLSCYDGEPVVELHLGTLPASVTHVRLSTTATDSQDNVHQQWDYFRNYPFSVLGVRFPFGTRGQVTFDLSTFLYERDVCPSAAGHVSLNLDRDAIFEKKIELKAQPSACDSLVPATLTVILRNAGSDDFVTSQHFAINCYSDSVRGRCSMPVPLSWKIRLHAESRSHDFKCWSGDDGKCLLECDGPTDQTDCLLTIKRDFTAVAIYR